MATSRLLQSGCAGQGVPVWGRKPRGRTVTETPASNGVMLLIRPACGRQTGAPAHDRQVGPKPSRNTRRQLSVESCRATEDASLASTPDGAPPASLTVVGHDRDGLDHARLVVGDGLKQRAAEKPLGLGERELDGLDRVAVVLGRRDVLAEFELRPVVRGASDPPGAAHPGLELAEVELPDLIGPDGGTTNTARRASACWRRSA